MDIKLKIDKLTLSTPIKNQNIYYPYHSLPEFKSEKHNKLEKDNNINKYENIVKYSNNKISLIICNKLKKQFKMASSIYILFYTDYYNKITYPDVLIIENFFKQLNIPLRVSTVHLALDIWSRKGIYDRVIMSLKPGKKRKPCDDEDLVYESSKYFGELSSGNQMIVYNKGKQMAQGKHIDIKEDVCRIELRMKIPDMNKGIKSIHTIHDLADYDWSFVYPKFYSFHFRTSKLKQKINDIGEDWHKPIWELREIMEKEFKIWPSNFYRDYLIDHPQLSILVPEALKNYKWKNDI